MLPNTFIPGFHFNSKDYILLQFLSLFYGRMKLLSIQTEKGMQGIFIAINKPQHLEVCNKTSDEFDNSIYYY